MLYVTSIEKQATHDCGPTKAFKSIVGESLWKRSTCFDEIMTCLSVDVKSFNRDIPHLPLSSHAQISRKYRLSTLISQPPVISLCCTSALISLKVYSLSLSLKIDSHSLSIYYYLHYYLLSLDRGLPSQLSPTHLLANPADERGYGKNKTLTVD